MKKIIFSFLLISPIMHAMEVNNQQNENIFIRWYQENIIRMNPIVKLNCVFGASFFVIALSDFVSSGDVYPYIFTDACRHFLNGYVIQKQLNILKNVNSDKKEKYLSLGAAGLAVFANGYQIFARYYDLLCNGKAEVIIMNKETQKYEFKKNEPDFYLNAINDLRILFYAEQAKYIVENQMQIFNN